MNPALWTTQQSFDDWIELNHDVTLYVEHFPYEDTITGQQYIRHVARDIGVTIH